MPSIDGYIRFTCDRCYIQCVTTGPDQELLDEHEGHDYQIVDVEHSLDADAIIGAIEADLENANYHSMTSLPSTIFANIVKIAPNINRADLALSIAESFNGI